MGQGRPKRGLVWLIASLLALICVALFGGWLANQRALAAIAAHELVPPSTYSKTIVVAADIDFDPYSFLDDAGKPTGYDVELAYALAQEMQVNVRFELMAWSECIKAIEAGRVDMICGMDYLPRRYPNLLFSTAIWSDPFVGFGKQEYSNIIDLTDQRLATIENSGCFDLLLEPYKLVDSTSTYSTYTEALQAVADDKADYAVVRYSVGRRLLASMGASGIKSVGPNLGNNPICIAVQSGDDALLLQLDVAIKTLKQNGTVHALAKKWLGTYVQHISLQDLFFVYGQTMLLASIVLLAVLLAVQFIAYKRKVAAVEHNNTLDVLTELLNKKHMQVRIRGVLSQPGADYFNHALLVLDIDSFKRVNDCYGHVAGDILLKETALRLQGRFRRTDVIGRFGGDEFVVFLECIPSQEWLKQQLGGLNELLAQPVPFDGEIISVSASIGAAFACKTETNYDTMFALADKALYDVKHEGKNNHKIVQVQGLKACAEKCAGESCEIRPNSH